MTFKYVELFAGIGGFRQALDRAGGECVFASEIDKFAAQAYEALYGEKPAGDALAERLQPILSENKAEVAG